MVKVCILALALAAICVAEPPAPQYLPPAGQYGPPTEVQDYMSPPPSPQYGAPSSKYGAPSQQYGAPSQQYGAPSQQYGAPSQQYGAPSTRYGAPSRSNGYRKSAASSSSTIRFGSSGRQSPARPSARYGVPSRNSLQTKAFFPAPAQQYGAPAQQYGAPALQAYSALSASQYSNGQRFGGATHSSPSAVYGAPAANGGYSYGKANDDDMSEPASYQFQYEVKDDQEGTDFGHREEREGDDARGEYRVLLPDGRTQVVTYTADERGYLPEIRFEEAKGGYGRGPASGYY
ncbi:pro-resilin-like [Hetaerina americana]|uniref:pro-resilin-like n=1 Tax=Hetaerina americana TaxID=62018 RepID=UPI003A7F4651